jgi:hypothetical protein
MGTASNDHGRCFERRGHGHGDGGQRRAELTEVRWRSAVEDTGIGRRGGVKRRRPGHRATRWRSATVLRSHGDAGEGRRRSPGHRVAQWRLSVAEGCAASCWAYGSGDWQGHLCPWRWQRKVHRNGKTVEENDRELEERRVCGTHPRCVVGKKPAGRMLPCPSMCQPDGHVSHA